jgi:hypothetical protein
MMFVYYFRDDLPEQTIMDYLDSVNIHQNHYNQMFATYKQLVIEIPSIMLSIDLDNPLERNKFLMPDWMMIGQQKDGPG